MTNELLNELTFFVLAIFVGFEVIPRCRPSSTPL